MDIQGLEAKDKEYQQEIDKIRKAQESVQTALDLIKTGRGQTQERMKAIVAEAIQQDKVDIRGVKISSKQFTYVLIALVLLLALLILMLPDTISQILIRLAGMIGGGTP
jgi:hypothetical protein